MTLKEMFKKIETYNKLATMVPDAPQAKIELGDSDSSVEFTFGTFSSLKEFKKYAKAELNDMFAEKIFEAENFEFDKGVEITWGYDDDLTTVVHAYIVSE